MGFAKVVLAVFVLYAAAIAPPIHSFNCTTTTSCNGLVGYISPNSTTLSSITSLFGITSLLSLLASNNLPLSTPPNHTLSASQTINIPFPCICANGTGIPKDPPLYTVVSGDTLDHIATKVFSGLVTIDQIQAFNMIVNASLIQIGQELKIPLPCSCDEVNGETAVHYGHVVASGSSVAGIAQQFNTTEDTLLKLNGLASPKDLLAGAVLDVPLKVCTSTVNSTSLDYPLLVTNGTYTLTAGNCVMCNCDASNNWTLQCKSSQLNSSIWTTCPSMQCQGAENSYLGNTTSSGCIRTTCAYAGYTNQTILTILAQDSTCPVSNNNNASKFNLQGWSWSFILILVQLVLLCHHFIH